MNSTAIDVPRYRRGDSEAAGEVARPGVPSPIRPSVHQDGRHTTLHHMSIRGWLLTFTFWTLVGLFQGSSWALAPGMPGADQPARLFAIALCNAYVWAFLTPLVLRQGAWAFREREARWRRVPVVVGTMLFVSAVVAVIAFTVHRLVLPVATTARPDVSGWMLVWNLGRWYGQQVAEFGAIIVVAVAVEMRRAFHAREREATDLQARASQLQAERAELDAHTAQLQAQSAELQAQLAEARLSVLRARLNPHFLFNTLNAVSALVAKNPRGVRDMIALLSELLRHALAESSEQEIPLRDELRLMRLYLEILEIRYQGQLRTEIAVDPDVHDALVPNLVLQPLVENAMKHGIDRAGGHGSIVVRARRKGDALELVVEDTGPGEHPGPQSDASGVGLSLTRGRLAELYGEAQQLQLEPRASGGMRAVIAMPYHTSADLRAVEAGARA
jgi:two-component system, LytTR family, sensor kinase